MLTLTTLTLYRHHLIAVFSLPLVWFARIALGGGGRRARTWRMQTQEPSQTLRP
jgi:hypothetical protein